jgi:lactoylglutathione lyase
MMDTAISLIVLRTSRTQDMLAFYRAFRLTFNEEKHGSGPVHHSTQIGSTVLEIYPGEVAEPINRKGSGATMLGFAVESLDNTLRELEKLHVTIISNAKDSPWGRRAVVADPDGRTVELNESKKN